MLKKYFIPMLYLLLFPILRAQDGTNTFLFLKLPFSSHASALGGENISIIEDDLTMAVQNSTLLLCVADDSFYLAAGYNFRRGEETKINGSNHWTGFSYGTGIRLKRLKLGMAYSKLHVS